MPRKSIPFILIIIILIVLILTQSQVGEPAIIQSDNTAISSLETTKAITPAATLSPTPTVPAFLQINGDKLRDLHVEFWHAWSGKAGETIDSLVTEFSDSNQWGIRVSAIQFKSETDLSTAIQAGKNSNELPNVTAAPIDQLLAWQQESPVLVDLTPYVQSSQYGLSAIQQADYFPSIWKQDMMDGFRIGLPAERSTNVIYYNKTWAEELGFESPPTNSEEFKTQACAAAQANNLNDISDDDGTGGWIINTSWPVATSWLMAYGTDSFSENDNLKFYNNNSIEALTFLRNLVDKGCAWIAREPDPYDYFAKRYALFFSGDLRSIYAQTLAFERSKNNDRWTILPYQGVEGSPAIILHGASYGVLLSTAEEQLASWLFIRWLSSTKNQVSLVRIEGSLPISYSAVSELGDYGAAYPMWEGILGWVANAQSTPRRAAWLYERVVIEDALWMALSAYVSKDNIPNILQQLDNTMLELSQLQ